MGLVFLTLESYSTVHSTRLFVVPFCILAKHGGTDDHQIHSTGFSHLRHITISAGFMQEIIVISFVSFLVNNLQIHLYFSCPSQLLR